MSLSTPQALVLKQPLKGRLLTAAQRLLLVPSLLTLFLATFQMRHWMTFPAFTALAMALIAGAYFGLHRSDYRTFVLYIVFFNLFNGLRTLADQSGIPVSYAYPVRIDSALFGGEPGAWLQAHFYTPGSLNALGWATLAVYVTYFTGHFVVALAIWRFKREWLAKFVTAIIVTLYIGLAIYFLVPTAPPWLASQHGDTAPIVRVTKDSQDHILAGSYDRGARIAGENDVGAMPSLHVALTVVIALMAMRFGRKLGALGVIYAAAMGFSLIYLGEHYFADEMAGALIALVAWKLVASPHRAIERVGRIARFSAGATALAPAILDNAKNVA